MKSRCEASTIDDLVTKCAIKSDPEGLLDVHIMRPGTWDKPSLAYERIGAGVETNVRELLAKLNIPVAGEAPPSAPSGPSFVQQRSFPAEFVKAEFPNVTHFGIFGAGVTSIPEAKDADLKSAFPSLESLDLERNYIQSLNAATLPSGIIGLNASNNPIKEIKNLKMLQNLKSLFLRGTGMTGVEGLSGIEELPLLDTVDLRDTKVSRISMPSNQNFHASMYHDKSGVVVIKSYLRRKSGSSERQTYPVAINECEDNLSTLPARRSGMYLNNLGLETLPECIGIARKADILDVSNNNNLLTMGLSTFPGKSSVKELYVSGNGLEAVDDIAGFTDLETLDASNNQLAGIPPEISTLPKLQTLNLSGNLIGSKTCAGSCAIGLISSVAAMKHLESIDLRSNGGLPTFVCNKKDVFTWRSVVGGRDLDKLKKGLKKGNCYTGR
jgi:hypothetical protein